MANILLVNQWQYCRWRSGIFYFEPGYSATINFGCCLSRHRRDRTLHRSVILFGNKMIIQKKSGNINSININNRTIDWLSLEWHETNKRILRKKTKSGKEVLLKFLNENPSLTEEIFCLKMNK
jgi:hypothetical protein